MRHLGAVVRGDRITIATSAGDVGAISTAADLAALCASPALAGRDHLSLWAWNSAQLDSIFLRLFSDSEGEPLDVSPHSAPAPIISGRGGLISASWAPKGGRGRKIHFRCVENITGVAEGAALGLEVERLGLKPESIGAAIVLWLDELQRALPEGGELRATAGGIAIDLWKKHNPRRGLWRVNDWARADFNHDLHGSKPLRGVSGEVDLHTAAIYGGRVEALAPGLHFDPYHKPRAPHWRLERVEHQRGTRFFNIDIRSAYPAIMRDRDVPDVFGPAVDRLILDKDGIAEVTIDLSGCDPVIPVARKAALGIGRQLSWPTGGIYRGVWTNLALWKATQTGAKILDIHYARSYLYSRPILRDTSLALISAIEGSGGLIRSALKKIARSVYGKLGQRREQTELLSSDEIAELKDGQILRYVGRWGDRHMVLIQREPHMHAIPLWAAQITATAAIVLSNAQKASEQTGERVLYLDTDSLTIASRWTRPRGVTLGGEIGDWSLKSRSSWLALFGPKMYTSSAGARAAAGIPAALQDRFFAEGGVSISREPSLRERIISKKDTATWTMIRTK